MLLQAHYIRVQSEHIVHSFVLEALYVDRFVFLEFNKVAYLMIIRDHHLFLIVKTQIEGVDTSWLFSFIHNYYIYFS